MLKKAAFIDEMNNVLFKSDGFVEKVVISYMKKRIREFDRKHR